MASEQKSYSNFDKKSWQEFKEKLDYLKSSVDVNYLLESLGVRIEKESPKEVRAACPIHGGDNTTAFRFNKDTNTWVCFTNKCHDTHGNDIISLIRALTGKDFSGAVSYLRYLVGDIENIDFVEAKQKRERDTFIRSYGDLGVKPESVNERSLSKFKSLRSNYFLRQGFKEATLDHFEIAGGWQDKYGLIRDIIPIRDDFGELMAYSLRDTRPNIPSDAEDYKYILTPGFDKQSCLYNLNNIIDITAELPIIVVEGFKSVWKLHEYGINNVVAVMGSCITEGQKYLLESYAMKGIVMLFDNDDAGVGGTIKALDDLSSSMEVRPVFIQEIDENGKGLDPADLTKEQVYDYLETYF